MGDNNKKKSISDRYHSGSKGAISVFLTLILVPCIVVVCLFDDVSRVQLSKSQASSAADLVLYSLMSEYDSDLKEMYGIVASSQSIGESDYTQAATNFKGIMNPNGISGKGSDMLIDYIARKGSSGDTSDLLQTEAEEVTVSSAGTLENSALLENGIVEFMKYRGPVTITARLIKRLSGLDLSQLEEADKNKEIADAKEKYAKSESELLEDAFHTYLAIRKYSDSQKETTVPSYEKYEEVSKKLRQIHDDLYSATELITKYYAATGGLSYINFVQMGENSYTVSEKEAGSKDSESDTYYLKYNYYENVCDEIDNNLDTYISEIETNAGSISDACSKYTYTEGTTNPAMWCLEIQNSVDQSRLGKLKSRSEKMLRLYGKINACLKCTVDEESEDPFPDDWNQDGGKLYQALNKIDSTYDQYLDDNSAYMQLVKTYKNTVNAAAVVDKVRNRKYTFHSKLTDGQQVTLDQFMSTANGYCLDMKDKLQERIDQLNVAINGGKLQWGDHTYDVKALEKLKKEVKTMSDNLNSWNSKAYGSDTEYAKMDQKESDLAKQGIRSTDASDTSASDAQNDAKSQEMSAHITAESVDELKGRLTNIKTDAQDCIDGVNELSYGKSKFSDFGTGGEGLIKAFSKVITDYNMSDVLSTNESDARGYAERLISPANDQLFKAPDQSTERDGNDPVLTKGHGNLPVLYEYLLNEFDGKEAETADNVDNAKKKLDDFQNQQDTKKEETLDDTSSYIQNGEKGSDIKNSTASTSKSYNLGTGISSLINTGKRIVNSDFGSIRDQLYTTEYVMDMFTCYTTYNQGKYQLANAKASDWPYSSVQDKWNTDSKTEINGSDGEPSNQSLTNYHFSTANNVSNLGEFEYVLYGNSGIDENFKKSWTSIFGVRESLNLASGFVNFYPVTQKNLTAAAINAAAEAVAFATSGIVPPVLTKTLAITSLATAETCKDVDTLKRGAPVTTYKENDTKWYYALSSNQQDISLSEDSGKTQPEDKNGLYYSEYLNLFLLMYATSGDSNYTEMCKRIGILIQQNVATKEDFSLKNAKCFYKLNAKMRVKPLMLELPIVNTFDGTGVSNFRQNTNWQEYTISTVRGYS